MTPTSPASDHLSTNLNDNRKRPHETIVSPSNKDTDKQSDPQAVDETMAEDGQDVVVHNTPSTDEEAQRRIRTQRRKSPPLPVLTKPEDRQGDHTRTGNRVR